MGLKTQVSIDGTMVLVLVGTVAVIAGGVYLQSKKDAITDAINPASEKNLIYDALTGDDGEPLSEEIYQTRFYNPAAWGFEVIGRITGDIPWGGH